MKRKRIGRCCLRACRAAVFCAALCLSILTGCGQEPEETGATVSVYYINKEETRITAVEKPLEGDTLEEQTKNTLESLGEILAEEPQIAEPENPVELSLRTTVKGFSVKSWEVKDAQLVLDMSTEYKKLPASTEVLIRAAIVRTLTQLEGIDNVSFTVGGETLTDSLGGVVGPMTAEMFIDNAGREINAYEKTRLKLYFADDLSAHRLQQQYLHGETGAGAAHSGAFRRGGGSISGHQLCCESARRDCQGRRVLCQS